MSQSEHAALIEQLESYRGTDPALLLKRIAGNQSITDPEFRHVRSDVLHSLATKLHRVLRECDFRNEIVVRPEGVFVNIGEVLMEVSFTAFYLKPSGQVQANQAEEMDRVLRRLNIAPRTVIDVGANFGEISLWFTREYPTSRVIAIEPSSYNMKILKLNKDAQRFPTDRLELIQEAVGDARGVASLTASMGSMNRIVYDVESVRSERVTCDRLDNMLDRCDVKTADFIKIDIEGSEPKLREALVALGERVRSYYVEFSQFAPLEDYMALAQSLVSGGFDCLDESGSIALRTTTEIAQHLNHAFAPDAMAVTNLWFVRD
jgi:FkbM family methyltransferase